MQGTHQESVIMRIILLILPVIIVFTSLACSGSQDIIATYNPVPRGPDAQGHYLWGMWQMKADLSPGELEVINLRGADMHLNALPFLEPPAMLNLTVESVEFNGNIVDVDIGLTHPFLGSTEFTGFDVCGILITNDSINGFSDSSVIITGEGDTRLLNPDGYTRWWNPSEFPHTGTKSGYTDGLLGIPDSTANYTATVNAYKLFCDSFDDPDTPVDRSHSRRSDYAIKGIRVVAFAARCHFGARLGKGCFQ